MMRTQRKENFLVVCSLSIPLFYFFLLCSKVYSQQAPLAMKELVQVLQLFSIQLITCYTHGQKCSLYDLKYIHGCANIDSESHTHNFNFVQNLRMGKENHVSSFKRIISRSTKMSSAAQYSGSVCVGYTHE